MPKINIAVPHSLGQEEAKKRLSTLIADARTRFASQVSHATESWNGYTDNFSFDAMGFSVSGVLDVQPSQVLVEINLPWAAALFKSRIENEIQTQARDLLG